MKKFTKNKILSTIKSCISFVVVLIFVTTCFISVAKITLGADVGTFGSTPNTGTPGWSTTQTWDGKTNVSPTLQTLTDNNNVKLNSTSNNTAVLTPLNTKLPGATSVNCGISASQLKYCMLAPLNGLLGTPTNSGSSSVEVVDIQNTSLSVFIAKLYKLGIAIAVALSIVVITFGGIKMATKD